MAASAKTLICEKANPTEEWTIVLPRRGRQRRYLPKVITPKQQEEQSWAPVDLETNPERELKLMQKMQLCIQKLENSPFFHTLLDQILTPENLDRFFKVLGEELNMQMVIYGLGSIESFEPPRLQLSLAIVLKRKFSWIGDIEVFDPIISLTEARVLEALGCSVLLVNEHGRRQALRPMLFFMPHCEAELYDNLLHANWRVDLLNRIVLFGNSFEAYEQQMSMFRNSTVADSRKHILASRRLTKELGINTSSDDFFRAFHGSGWHFFTVGHEADLHPVGV
ncbi:unnamed protein product [Ilex paraguariensis]|uniref:SRR1-like domain-containing protein n=1 Tax=Ilex paraguariensis TaxID=185542 RepID=A0ABC8TI86_9AQUA